MEKFWNRNQMNTFILHSNSNSLLASDLKKLPIIKTKQAATVTMPKTLGNYMSWKIHNNIQINFDSLRLPS